MKLVDSCSRRIEYLRLSVTDRCNLRCVYCVPETYTGFARPEEVLSVEEVVHLVSCFVDLGISKIRITGGEPLLRPDLCELVEAISRFPGISDVSLSTNGTLLDRFAVQLKNAGLSRVNISLDTLDRGKFQRITRFGKLENVLAGIEAAVEAGLSPVKLNVVVARGINDDEIIDFTRMTEALPVHVRFIELMPMGESGFFSMERWIPLGDMMQKASPVRQLPESDWPPGHGPARYFERPNGVGTIGFISALSDRFCSSCNRVRLSSRGVLVPCLDVLEGTDLRRPLRDGESREEIMSLILHTISEKPEGHTMKERIYGLSAHSPLMCQIGG